MSDAFADDRACAPSRRARPTRMRLPRAALVLTLAAVACAGAALLGAPTLGAQAAREIAQVPLLALAVALGAVTPGKQLARALPVAALAALAAFASLGATPSALVAFALALLGFGALGRGLLFSTLHFVARREQARVDQELLRLHEDARLMRVLGSTGAGDDGASDAHDAAHAAHDAHDSNRALAARTLAASDACYRLLALGTRALNADGGALYLLDGDALVKKEQALLDVVANDTSDGTHDMAPRLAATAGACGLALKKGRAVRLVDADAARAHRKAARSVLALPLFDAAHANRAGAVRPLGVIVFDRRAPALFDEHDEALALALTVELANALTTERVLVDLDDERRRTQRVFDAARAFSGVVRLEDALDQTLAVAHDLAPRASVAVVVVERAPGQPPVLFVARARSGAATLPLAEGERFALDEGSWVGRAFVQREVLPHRSADLALHGLYARTDRRTKALGDLRVVPLSSHGDVGALLVVALPPGERLREQKRRALEVLGDIAGTAIGGAKLFFAVEQKATTDGLTGLVNRRTLDEKLAAAIARAKRSRAPLAVVLADIDHFKSVNDTYGHAAGDQVLVGVAKALAGTARETDVVARYGGEEMCCVLEATDAAGAVRLAERMRLAIKGLAFETDKGPLSVTSSFGVALLQDGEDALAVRERADAALYRSKHAGRDRVTFDDAGPARDGPVAPREVART